MKSETIKMIFTNILFVVGVALLIVGFTKGVLTASRIVVFDKYPLQSYEETKCEMELARPIAVSKDENVAQLSDEELKSRMEKCQASLEQQRNVQKTEDIVTSVSFLAAGLVLALIFKRFILK